MERFKAKEQRPCVTKAAGAAGIELNATIAHRQNNRKDEARVEAESDGHKERERVATTTIQNLIDKKYLNTHSHTPYNDTTNTCMPESTWGYTSGNGKTYSAPQ
jgi:hypothetical protein